MKIITRTVIDIESFEVIEEQSYEYEGPVSWCGSSGGGGGGSGKVSYPDYMENIHANWLTGAATLSGRKDIISGYEWIPSSNSPNEYYLTEVGGGDPGLSKPNKIYEDSEEISEGAVGGLDDNLSSQWDYGDNDSLGFDTIYVSLVDDSDPDSKDGAYLKAEYTSYDPEVLKDESLTGLLKSASGNSPYDEQSAYDPSSEISNMKTVISSYESYIENLESLDSVDVETANFDAAMRDANAVNTSNFIFGRQNIASKIIEVKADAKKKLADLKVEVERMEIAAKNEQNNIDRKIAVKDQLWKLEIFKMAGNVLAGIGGGTANIQAEESPSETQSALAGGLSGAATGASIGTSMAKGTSYEGSGGAYGAAAGAALGIGSALLSS